MSGHNKRFLGSKHTVEKRVSVTAYFVLIYYRHCSEFGRLVMNTCIPTELFTAKLANSSSCAAVNKAFVS